MLLTYTDMCSFVSIAIFFDVVPHVEFTVRKPVPSNAAEHN